MSSSLQNIKLPHFALAQLFSNNTIITKLLVASDEAIEPLLSPLATDNNTKADIVKPLLTPINFLGNNAKKITIVVNEPRAVYISEESLEFLGKLLTACKLSINDVAIVNVASNAITYNQCLQQLQSQQVLLFGVLPQQIKIENNFTLFIPQALGASQFLTSTSLHILQQNAPEIIVQKKQLWQGLKQMFGV